VGDGVDLKPIFEEVNKIGSLASTDVSGTLEGKANSLPAGTKTDSEGMNWGSGGKKRLTVPLRWTSTLSDWGIASETDVAVICGFQWGGTYNGKGHYIANLRLGFTVDKIGLGQSFDLSGEFNDPTPGGSEDDPIASLGAVIKLTHRYVTMVMESYTINFVANGDGSGSAEQA